MAPFAHPCWRATSWVRFRTPLERGYAGESFGGNLLEGLWPAAKPRQSVFLYVPLLLALPWAIGPFARRFRPAAALIGLLVAITLVQGALVDLVGRLGLEAASWCR
ncbi:MAG: hypothetical protein U0Z44_14565 [Kouleothrix sp.]